MIEWTYEFAEILFAVQLEIVAPMPPCYFKPPKPVHIKSPVGKIPGISSPELLSGKSLIAGGPMRLTTDHLEKLRNSIRAKLGRKKEVHMKVYATYPVTRKPEGVKMGQGKGNISHFVARVPRGGSIIHVPQMSPFTDFGVTPNFSAFRHATAMLPMKSILRSQNNAYAVDCLINIQAQKNLQDKIEREQKKNWWFRN